MGFLSIIIIAIIFIMILFPVIPFLIRNMNNVLKYGIADIVGFIHYKRFNECSDFGKKKGTL